MRNRKLKIIALAALVVLAGAACDNNNTKTKARNADENTSAEALIQLQQSQPIPTFNWSQLRQNLIEIETAQAQTTQTTSFFFNLGVAKPVMSCPSIGYPIPATDQLTNPEGKVKDHDLTLPLVEVTGVYTGDTTGTHVICVDPTGNAYDNYWEGFVQTVTGPAVWDQASGQVTLTGAPSVKFSTGQ